MKSNILKYLLISVIFMGVLSSCEKKFESADLSTMTYYPDFTMEGNNVMIVQKGVTFEDPGVTAAENGKDIDVDVSVVGEYSGFSGNAIDTSVPDRYTITYSAKNSDGYSGNVERVIWVVESEALTVGIAGLYKSTITRDGNLAFEDVKYIMIWNSGATYKLSCAVGGYYYLARAYGYGYAAQGATITVNDLGANDFTLTDAQFPLWGNMVAVSSFNVDAGSNTVSYTGTGDWGSVFEVTLTKVNL